MEAAFPYKAEYAKSNRSGCKGCKMTIGMDSLRIGIMVQSPHFDGMVPHWHHLACFFRKKRPKACTEIEHFDTLRWDDQKKIKDSIDQGGSAGDSKSGGGKALEKNLYTVEYAKSNRSKCRSCDNTINKGVIRMGVKDFDSADAHQYGPLNRWHHVDCFITNRDDLEIPDDFDITNVTGFNSMKDDDRAELKKKLKPKAKSKKRKLDTEAPETATKKTKVDDEKEAALREQTELLWKIRDQLNADVNTNALRGLLEYNRQHVPGGESKLLDRVSDMMAFGPLKPCPECEGQLVYSATGYNCTGMATEWTKCLYMTRQPKRRTFKIPTEYHDVDFLKNFKFKKRDRLFPYDAETAAALSQPALQTSAAKAEGSAANPDKPLSGMRFIVASGVKYPSGRTKDNLEETLRSLGASIIKKVDKKVAAVIATQEAVDAMKPKVISDAKNADVHVVKEDFVDAVKKGGAVLLIQSNAISSWGSDPLTRVGEESTKSTLVGKSTISKSLENRFKKELTTIKMKVKGGAAVDPDSGLEDSCHIMQETNGDPLNAVLGMVDLVRGNNSYYKLQALASDHSNKWHVFRSWGRIGTSIGGNKLETYSSNMAARQQFMSLYKDKTGNSWEKRNNFTKVPNKFFPLEMDYGEEEDGMETVDMSKSKSDLPKNVQSLIQFIFDIESMKQTMMEFEIDLKKMPLGKLSRKQIEKAYSVLTELNGLLSSGGSTSKILDASTRFYTLIPHDFGMRKPPLLDTSEVIKSKTEMLDNLLEIEIAYSMMKTGKGEDPIDAHYKKLNNVITPLDHDSDEYKRIVEYVANTHAPTHSSYNLEVEDIFEVSRQGEEARYKAFQKMHNRRLLWHGSRRTNWAGILSQGLRIAPPEAPVTGYMFGKGIYFADMVSKSANYCFTNRASPDGLMLLCEVALGNMSERFSSDSQIKLKPGEHSCKGVGRTFPDPKGDHTRSDGILIPMGKHSTDQSKNTSLLYNEYIVYDVAQVKQKYLLRMKFNYKY